LDRAQREAAGAVHEALGLDRRRLRAASAGGPPPSHFESGKGGGRTSGSLRMASGAMTAPPRRGGSRGK